MTLQEVLTTIIGQMADGDSEWEMPWHGKQKIHINVESGKAYTSINRLILWSSYKNNKFRSRHWGTFSQWRARRQSVEGGQTGTVLVRPVFAKKSKPSDEPTGYRIFHVFNGDQVVNRNEDHPDLFGEDEIIYSLQAEKLVAETRADIHYGGNRAFYSRETDHIEIPDPGDFIATHYSTPTQNFYATLLHELVHWTGHSSRENRQPVTEDKYSSYAFEELVAELGAAFICVDCGLETSPRKDHAQYLNSWIKMLLDSGIFLFEYSLSFIGVFARPRPLNICTTQYVNHK